MSDEYIIKTVAEDLEYLGTEWGAEVSDPSLRRGSTTLRKLLVEGDLFRAWRAAKRRGKPTVVGPRLESGLFCTPTHRPVLAIAGGGEFGHVAMQLAILHEATTEGQPPALPPEATAFTFTASEFAESASVFVDDASVTRAQVIKYVANKLGGAHTDFKRRSDEAAYELLDRNAPRLNVATSQVLPGKDAVYFELLSIGQLIGRSASIREFVSQVRGRIA